MAGLTQHEVTRDRALLRDLQLIVSALERIAAALERAWPPPPLEQLDRAVRK
jgi:hypothetical protein